MQDTTSADFSAGAVDAGAYIAETADGEVILAPAFGAEFSGGALPAGMSATQWFPPNGSAKVAGGRLTLDGARAGTDALFGPGRSLEFSAELTGASLDASGFGQTFTAAPWAVFRTGFFVFNLMTGTNSGTSQNSNLTGSFFNAFHRYRIDWSATSVVYSVDGVPVATHTNPPTSDMRPLFSDFFNGGRNMVIDWFRMGPYAASAQFTSRVFDAGGRASWLELQGAIQAPQGTSVLFETRSGDTPAPDETWSAWLAPAGASIGSPEGRYLQYRASLATSDPSLTPVLQSVSISYVPACSPEICNGIDDDCDGVVDNGDPGGGLPCGTGLPGVCAPGVTHCTGGGIQCAPLAAGSPEVCDGLDNDCNGIVDDGFVDSDGDGQADCVDPDDDNDGSPDDADCAPLDPNAFLAPPEEVRDLHWAEGGGGRTMLFWTDQGSGMRYDLASGTVSSLLADRSAIGAACIAADLAVPQFDDTRPDPLAGEAYYYVVRSGKSGCGFGTYGFESSGEELQLPNACPPAGAGRPDIDVAPASVDFGDVRAGLSASGQVTVRNVGSAALHVNGLTLSGASAFKMVDAPATPLTLNSGTSFILTLSYGPSGPGPDSGTLEIDSDDSEEPTTLVPLAGRGVAPLLEVQPASIDFGQVSVGSQADRTVSVRNAGNADLTLQAPSLAAGSSPFFSVGSPGITLLPPSASTTFIVSFQPGSEGPATGSVLVTSDGGTFSLPLSGRGVTGATVVSLALNRASLSLAQGDCFQLRAIATLSDTTTQDVTQSALWSALDPAVVSVGTGGLVLAMSRGGTMVSASFSGFSAAAAVDVVDPGTLRLALPCGEFAPGSPFDADVRIDAGPRPLGAYALLITYDPTVVVIGGIGGGSSAPFNASPGASSATFSSGSTLFAAYQAAGLAAPTGVVSVARISFQIHGAPGSSAPIALQAVTLAATDLTDLPGTNVPVIVQVQP